MIDVKKLRENPEIFYKAAENRFYGKEYIDRFFELDGKWRENLKRINDLKHEKNIATGEISKKIKDKLDVELIKERVRELNSKIDEMESEQKTIEAERNKAVYAIPNLLHETVPICKGDENNRLVKTWGVAKVFRDDMEEFRKATENRSQYIITEKRPLSHVDLADKLRLVDLERAGKVAGARFYYLKNRLLKLEMALENFAVDFLSERGFSVVEPPYMLNYQSMSGATDMETFRDTLYKIEGEDLYLISTSEHAIASMLRNEILEENELPLRIAGFSPCFRKEAGAHGKDTKGIFRVHQFNKIEQFIFCREEDSWDFLEELLKNSEEIFQKLNIPYRVVNVCSGELGSLAAKKYDIEAWFGSQGKFREVVSASNDTDYQARTLDIRYRTKDGNLTPHTLNSTAIATTRVLVAIMENNQTEDGEGIIVPEALVPYTGFDIISAD
ncbi:serine--tRNA ligase [Oxyplasma meridianum]|uniref:Serine--tRNA ligase n=1 Tax=Oxyplasma meridianum TaxID=3073602 RepID=A0AAX4NFU8_9ARCH